MRPLRTEHSGSGGGEHGDRPRNASAVREG
jgi:hypothetical protein